MRVITILTQREKLYPCTNVTPSAHRDLGGREHVHASVYVRVHHAYVC